MSNTKSVMSIASNTWAGPTYIEDVFSTYLYTGNGSTQTITNGIDLAGEGGMVWFKNRQYSYDHLIWDTERGSAGLFTNSTAAQNTGYSSFFTSYNSDGISFTGSFIGNASGSPHVAWTWRKAPRFFDCVTWTGDGTTARPISHNLGAEVGCIIVKRTDSTGNWSVYHRGLATPATDLLYLNLTNAVSTGNVTWGNQLATSSEFFVTGFAANSNGATYVAYLFAHDPLGPSGDGSDGLIACGSFTSAASQQAQFVELGWEPQWLLVKTSTGAGSWRLVDCMRGIVTGGTGPLLYPDTNYDEATITNQNWFEVNPTGFTLTTSGWSSITGANNTAIYIAIRRGPMRQPESGTEVFDAYFNSSSVTLGQSTGVTIVPDFVIARDITAATRDFNVADRMRGAGSINPDASFSKKALYTNLTNAEASDKPFFDIINKHGNVTVGGEGAGVSGLWGVFLKRAPGFFDVVAYTGNGVAGRTVPHNLGVAPEMMIVKRRDALDNWLVYHSGLNVDGDGLPETDAIVLDTNGAAFDYNRWQDTAPTSTEFTVHSDTIVNGAGGTYIAYLFATLPGVSKVGSYTGNGTSQTINCGFTTGARFILIKRTDSTGDWYIWDTKQGIVAGNDPRLKLNDPASQITTDDSVDPDSSGFIVNQVAATNINVSSASYIFYAIA